jgi:hypothetical protein
VKTKIEMLFIIILIYRLLRSAPWLLCLVGNLLGIHGFGNVPAIWIWVFMGRNRHWELPVHMEDVTYLAFRAEWVKETSEQKIVRVRTKRCWKTD